MKKTLLAAALAVGFAGAAQATSVTLYGVVDAGIAHTQVKGNQYYSSAQRDFFAAQEARGIYGSPNGGYANYKSTKNGVDSGIKGASRWGLKGVEDLGNGLKATFVLESQLDTDTGNSQARLFHRQATVGLAGDSWGTVELGRQTNIASKYVPGIANPFGAGWKQAGIPSSGMSAAATVRYDNMIQYRSPNFSGFEFGVGFTMNADGDENASRNVTRNGTLPGSTYGSLPGEDARNLYPGAVVLNPVTGNLERTTGLAGTAVGGNTKNANKQAISLGLRYANGPLAVALTYDQLTVKSETSYFTGFNPQTVPAAINVGPRLAAPLPINYVPTYGVDTSSTKVSSWLLAASYDFEVVKLHAGFGHTRNGVFVDQKFGAFGNNAKPGNLSAAPGLKINGYSLGVSVPLGGGKLMAGWQMADPRSKPDSWKAGSSNWDGLVRVDRFDPVTGVRLVDGLASNGQRFTNAYTSYATVDAKNAALAALPAGVTTLPGQLDATVERNLKRQHTFSIGYDYALSKRTSLYALGSYAKNANFNQGTKATLFAVGMHHTF